jgi:uncharacterized protein
VRRAQVTIDGPPDVHDRYRPKLGGGSTFWRIVDNLHVAVEHLNVNVRVNVEPANFGRVEELLAILADEGLADKVSVGTGRLYTCASNPSAPSASYGAGFAMGDYARAELDFATLAARHGFRTGGLPTPSGTPCTAVRSTEIVVGSTGEMWKCWDDVGNQQATIGHIADYKATNARLAPWLEYDPFADEQCRSCVALPGCMGGCAHRALNSPSREDRCGTFRFTHVEKVRRAAMSASGHQEELALPVFDSLKPAVRPGGQALVERLNASTSIPVQIRPRVA